MNGTAQLGPVVELNQEEFVLRIGRAHELRHRLPRPLQLSAHAAAGIENHADRKRHILTSKRGDLLRDLILGELEVVLFQTREEFSGRGDGHRDGNQHQGGIDAKIRAAVQDGFASISAEGRTRG